MCSENHWYISEYRARRKQVYYEKFVTNVADAFLRSCTISSSTLPVTDPHAVGTQLSAPIHSVARHIGFASTDTGAPQY